MKITKLHIVNMLKEELGKDPEMLKAINLLTNSINNLDVSIDYLSSAVTGEDPLRIGALQQTFGRFASPGLQKSRTKKIDETYDIIIQELGPMLAKVYGPGELETQNDEIRKDLENILGPYIKHMMKKQDTPQIAHTIEDVVRDLLMRRGDVNEKIENAGGGDYYATSKSGKRLSKKPKSKKDAQAQLAAVEISKAERGKK